MRAIDEDIGRFAQIDPAERPPRERQERREHEESDDAGRRQDGVRTSGGRALSCGGDHFGRRRLSRGKGGGEGIAARQARGDFKCRMRPIGGIAFECARDRQVDRRVEIFHQRRR